MLLERLTLMPEEDASILRDRTPLTRELNLQDPNEVMTELIRNLGYHEFKTIEANPNRWAMQANLVKLSAANTHKIQIFINIITVDNIYVQVEIVRQPDKPIILQKGNFKTIEVLDMLRSLPYFPNPQAMEP
ncbi:hypothetical protein [Brunnivagina elsteri]|uniref:Uncharacterized protein n=1 Tax=Brunnivagina elsteri CCALA 953 TaxID=987040 RepID=A0A2A2TAC1_9CYAN|nr:hypothetical protein [Calothrix elsteri]PAX47620.1 hypothetical protein CK510_28650 [Calothrix elsteri CCALA 953]